MKNILPRDGICTYHPNFLSEEDSSRLFDYVVGGDLIWRSDKIKMFGKVFDQPRRVAFYGESGVKYTYSKIEMHATAWDDYLANICAHVAELTGFHANTVLINYYRDGQDYMSWHSDSEKELGENPTIVSLSVGAPRRFLLRHRETQEKIELTLESGSLLVMKGSCQHHWQHSLPKMLAVHEGRVNLTFRSSSARV